MYGSKIVADKINTSVTYIKKPANSKFPNKANVA